MTITAHSHSGTPAQASGELAPTQLDIVNLARRCASESERFYAGQAHNTAYGFELFRRALVERNERAWDMIYQLYAPLVERWIRNTSALGRTGESSDYFVGPAFVRFWSHVSNRFDSFCSLPALLNYLKQCARCVVIDFARAHSWSEMLPEELAADTMSDATLPEDGVTAQIYSQELWQVIDSQLHDEAERVVVYQSFVLDMKPQSIFSARSDLFGSVRDVYNVKRNVLGRLERSSHLRQFLGI